MGRFREGTGLDWTGFVIAVGAVGKQTEKDACQRERGRTVYMNSRASSTLGQR